MTAYVIETLTPLHIGSGEKLSPFGDYIYDKNEKKVYLIDLEKLSQVLNDPERNLMDEYVQKVFSSSNSNHYTLKHFFEDYQINYRNLVKTEIKVKDDLNSEHILATVKSGTRPYIPGSSIKGALRTGILYTHRKKDGYTIHDALGNGAGNKKKRLSNQNGEDLFGNYHKDLFKFLHISDTELLDEDEIEVVKTYRFHLLKEKANIPVVKEVIPADKKLRFRLQVKAKKNYHTLGDVFAYFYESEDASGERKILQMANHFALDMIRAELEILRKNPKREITSIIQQYEQLLAIAERCSLEENGCVIRLGSGKTYFDNTIARLFTDEDIDKLPLGRKEKGLFPRTRAFISNHGAYEFILGWVKIQQLEE